MCKWERERSKIFQAHFLELSFRSFRGSISNGRKMPRGLCLYFLFPITHFSHSLSLTLSLSLSLTLSLSLSLFTLSLHLTPSDDDNLLGVKEAIWLTFESWKPTKEEKNLHGNASLPLFTLSYAWDCNQIPLAVMKTHMQICTGRLLGAPHISPNIEKHEKSVSHTQFCLKFRCPVSRILFPGKRRRFENPRPKRRPSTMPVITLKTTNIGWTMAHT